jgi:hypothetical protein
LRTADLKGAADNYRQALTEYRAIDARLGAANCLNGLGQLALAAKEINQAFHHFLEAWSSFVSIQDRLGEQAALGYLAKSAAAATANDQAFLLAEESLTVGRQIADPFGQTITLRFQLQLFAAMEETAAILATALLLEQAGRAPSFPHREILESLPAEERTRIEENAEAVRVEAVERARERFTATGQDLFAPPAVAAETRAHDEEIA